MKENKRRDFLKFMARTSVLSAVMPMMIPEIASANTPSFGDYKALVYVNLAGGNDAFNMVVPTNSLNDANDGTGYKNYANIRTSLSVSSRKLQLKEDGTGNLDLSVGNPYDLDNLQLSNAQSYLKGLYYIPNTEIGINAVLPEVAHLMQKGELAVLANIGTLVKPVTKIEIKNTTVPLPIHLFAHDQQTRVQQTGQADNKSISGWAGRLYDNWDGINGSNLLGNNISFAGNSYALIGRTSQALNLATYPTKYITQSVLREQLYNSNTTNPFHSLYDRMLGRSFVLSNLLVDALKEKNFTTLDAYGNALFSMPSSDQLKFSSAPNGSLTKQLEAVSKMISYGKATGVKRQIFYVSIGGFDTHSNQLLNHSKQLRDLSMGLGKFQLAMDELGLSDEVTTFTLSDFGRSIANNGDGTDHAWAGHNLVLGGAVKGGKVYGNMPDLTLEGPQDYGRNGRMIPTLSVDQQLATLLKWFGVSESLMPIVLPNIANFDATVSKRDIGFMKTV